VHTCFVLVKGQLYTSYVASHEMTLSSNKGDILSYLLNIYFQIPIISFLQAYHDQEFFLLWSMVISLR